MGKIEEFQKATELLRREIKTYETDRGDVHVTAEQDAKDAEVMSNPDNWCCVRVTDELPLYDQNGNIILPSLAMKSNYEIERHTVHTTLNHAVESHNAGNWDAQPYIVFCPYNDVVAQNGKPVGLDLVDTYFSTDIDVGLVLPKESAYIIRPSSDSKGELYKIGEHAATYKTGNFTNVEIAKILALSSPQELKEYNRLMNGDLTEGEIQAVLGKDPRVKRWYENAPDKKMFLRGLIMDEDRMIILTRFLRNAVLRLTMDKKGFQYIDDAAYRAGDTYGQCNSQVAKAIEDVAINERIETGAWCHDTSVYGKFHMQLMGEVLRQDVDRIVSEKNMDKLFDTMYDWDITLSRGQKYMNWNNVIVNGQFPDDYYDRFYEPYFQKYKQQQSDYLNQLDPEYLKRYGYRYSDMLKFNTIEDFDPNFAKVLKRQVVANMTKLRKWRAQMQNNPKFQKLLEKWNNYVQGNFEDLNAFIKPSIEQQFAQPQQIYQNSGRNII